MSFDVAKLDTRAKSEAGAPMTVRHPGSGRPIVDEDGKTLTITFRGRNSDAYRAIQREIGKRKVDRAAADIQPTEAEQRADMAKLVAAMTIDWGFTEMDGEPFPPSLANIEKLWADSRWTWLLEQAFVFVSTEGNFLAL